MTLYDQTDCVAGIDIGGTTTSVALLNLNGQILKTGSFPTRPRNGFESVLCRLSDHLTAWLQTMPGTRLRGIGVATAGLVDAETGILTYAANLPGWEQSSVVERVQTRFHVPVCLENDANAAALGEYAYGAGKRSEQVLMVTLGTGVGGGLILNGSIYRGVNGLAGELGHNCIDPKGPICPCGRRGCLEAFIGQTALVQRYHVLYRTAFPESVSDRFESTRDISAAADSGDRVALRLYQELGDHLALGLSHTLNLLDLERIVLGGGVANAAPYFLPTTRRVLYELLLDRRIKPHLAVAELGEQAGMLGAGYSILQQAAKG
mgnify:CR=1 FL=1